MDLWIRSQAKMSLVKVYAVSVLENDNIYTIIGYTNHDSQFWLADYDTKRRALEVLDEIQEVLCPKVLIMKPQSQINISDNVNLILPDNCSYERIGDTYVYEMPEE